jgi:hypothetical protein
LVCENWLWKLVVIKCMRTQFFQNELEFFPQNFEVLGSFLKDEIKIRQRIETVIINSFKNQTWQFFRKILNRPTLVQTRSCAHESLVGPLLLSLTCRYQPLVGHVYYHASQKKKKKRSNISRARAKAWSIPHSKN